MRIVRRIYTTVRGSDNNYVEADAWIGTPEFLSDHAEVLKRLGYSHWPRSEAKENYVRFDKTGVQVEIETACMRVAASPEVGAPSFKPLVARGFKNDVRAAISEIDPNIEKNYRVMEPVHKIMRQPRKRLQ
jgi:hypothetical protein